MSRLHRQKLRLRSQQRADGIIDADSDQVDREALQELGTRHPIDSPPLANKDRVGSVELLTPSHSADPDGSHAAAADVPPALQGLDARTVDSMLEQLTPRELELVRQRLESAQRARISSSSTPGVQASSSPGAQNPPL